CWNSAVTTSLLLPRNQSFSVRAAAAYLSGHPACVPAVRDGEHLRLLISRVRVRAPAHRAFEHDELAHSGASPLFFLERDLRGRAGAIHSVSYAAGAD